MWYLCYEFWADEIISFLDLSKRILIITAEVMIFQRGLQHGYCTVPGDGQG